MSHTARRTAVVTLVAGGIVVLALALWKLRLVVGLLFAAAIIAAAMRPGVEWLYRRRVPRVAGVLLHYVALVALVAAALWLIVPRALDQVDTALSPGGKQHIARVAAHSHGIKHDILTALQSRLQHLPKASHFIGPAASAGKKAVEIGIGVFFTFAAAAYWLFERDRVIDLVTGLLPRPKRKVVRDTWQLIDLKLGAFVRGQLLLILLVAAVLSLLFWLIGEPYWILVGGAGGVLEIVPVIGPLAAGALAVGVGLTASVHVGVLAAVCVLAVRLVEDYVVMPNVIGESVGLSPLLVLVSVSAVGILFSGWAVLFAVPIAAVAATLFDVVLREVDPAEQDVPTVIFSAKEGET